ncbi:alanine dehydrogenase, partial [bacterium]
DRRVILSPEQCKKILGSYKGKVSIKVQSSDIRCISDAEYTKAGIEVSNDLSDCDILLGIKEVPVSQLIADKTYMFFSHTIKLQEYNKKLLQEVLKKNIKLIDYEVITDSQSKRLIGFGKYAGIAGAYSGFRAVGKKLNLYDIKPAYEVDGRHGINEEMKKVELPANFKIVMTGDGRVTSGALEVIETLGIRKVSPEDFLNKEFNHPVYTSLRSKDFYKAREGKWIRQDFYDNPHKYQSDFFKYTKVADMYIACHYWNPKADIIFTKEDMKSPDFKIKVIADISCDIDGPIPSTVRPSTIPSPFYGYDPILEKEVDFYKEGAIGVMAVDNLPCELPKDASKEFGDEFIEFVLPNLLHDHEQIIERATITDNGQLTERYQYMKVMLK